MSSSSGLFRLLVVVLIAAIGVLVFVDYSKRKEVALLLKQQLNVQQVQGGNTQANMELAKEMVAKVRKLMDIPTDVEPTVAQIVNVAVLRANNAFYNKANNGDYLIVTKDRAILYSPSKNVILDVVPVQLQPQAAQDSSASTKGQSSVPVRSVPASLSSSAEQQASSEVPVDIRR